MDAKDSNTKAYNQHTSQGAQPGHYTDAGEAMGDIQGYQEDNRYLCENLCAPFTSGKGFQLASWFFESKVPKSQINDYFTN